MQQNNGTWTENQELEMPVSVTVCFAWYQCKNHCLQNFGQIAEGYMDIFAVTTTV